jgi:putative oxidoreductase
MNLKQLLFNPGREGGLRDFGLLALRVGFAGTLVLGHGFGKLQGVLAGSTSFPDPLGIGAVASLWLATFAEFFCALAVALGLMSRWASVPIVINFLVAFFLYHAGDPMKEKELAFVYLVAFCGLICTGPGRFSLDSWLRRK